MTNDEMIQAITENTQRSKSNSHRLEELQKNSELLHEMVTALEVLATQQKNIYEQVEKIDSKVTRLEQSPVKRIYTVVGYILAALCSAVAGVAFSSGFDIPM